MANEIYSRYMALVATCSQKMLLEHACWWVGQARIATGVEDDRERKALQTFKRYAAGEASREEALATVSPDMDAIRFLATEDPVDMVQHISRATVGAIAELTAGPWESTEEWLKAYDHYRRGAYVYGYLDLKARLDTQSIASVPSNPMRVEDRCGYEVTVVVNHGSHRLDSSAGPPDGGTVTIHDGIASIMLVVGDSEVDKLASDLTAVLEKHLAPVAEDGEL